VHAKEAYINMFEASIEHQDNLSERTPCVLCRLCVSMSKSCDSVYALGGWGCGDKLDRDTPRSGSYQDTV
jgi:hypothetical protein